MNKKKYNLSWKTIQYFIMDDKEQHLKINWKNQLSIY